MTALIFKLYTFIFLKIPYYVCNHKDYKVINYKGSNLFICACHFRTLLTKWGGVLEKGLRKWEVFFYYSSSSLVKRTNAFRHDTLLSHDKSKCHQHCRAAQRVKEPDAPKLLFKECKKWSRLCLKKWGTLMYTAYYIAKEKLPFSQFPSLHGLIQRTCRKRPDCYDSDKACARSVCLYHQQL